MKRSIPLLILLTTFAGATLAQTPAPTPEFRARAEASRFPALAQVPTAPNAPDRPTYAFQISLLLAEIDGSGSYEGLSNNARKALEDLRDFLPFDSYRLLDFAWLRTSVRSSARVQGPDGRTFKLTLNLGGLRDDDDSSKIYISNFDLRETTDVNLDAENGLLRRPQELISTSFGMEEGETVVVGTSRLDGDQRALVVLLTAVPASLAGG